MRSVKCAMRVRLAGVMTLAMAMFNAPGQTADLPVPQFELSDYGTEEIIDYARYGEFKNVGAGDYKYAVKDFAGLSRAAGTGIYPNSMSVFKEKAYQKYYKSKQLADSHWNYNGRNHELNFYRWVIAEETPGVKYLLAAINLERAGLIRHAVKAYHSIIVHFPRSYGLSAHKTPWYPGLIAADRLERILRDYPELNIAWKDGEVSIQNIYDKDTLNDVVLCKPGRLEYSFVKHESTKTNKLKIRRSVGHGKVRLVQYENGHWQLLVKDKPFVVRGMAYSPTPVGQSPEFNTLTDWMRSDINHNQKIDAAYESWVDTNRNNVQDASERSVGDFKLMQKMGVNALRIYHNMDHPNSKEVLRKLYKDYKIMALMGNFVGMYARDSGATWQNGTDYKDPVQRETMFKSVKKMVMDHKDEPYLLMWVLGNENGYGVACNADKYPKEYFQFINQITQWIHSTDPNHPVAVCNGDLVFLDVFAKAAPDVDILGSNAYRGEYGFGKSFWRSVHQICGKPVLITEYGCPSYFKNEDQDYAEEQQARYHEGNWTDIESNLCGQGYGNAIGGVVFEWLDEWWKSMDFGDPLVHKTKPTWQGPFPDGNMYEEWLGIASQGGGQHSPFLRQLRKVYTLYSDQLWNRNPKKENNYRRIN